MLLHFDVFDRIVVKLKVRWLPLWISKEGVKRILAKYGEANLKSGTRKTEWHYYNGQASGTFPQKRRTETFHTYLTCIEINV